MNTLTLVVAAALSLELVLVDVAAAQESEIALKEAPGKDKVMQCAACHSLDYIPMNSPFLNKAGWNATVTKMINVYGAPISQDDVEVIVNYLADNYGKPTGK